MVKPIEIILRGRDEGASRAIDNLTNKAKGMGIDVERSAGKARDALGRFVKSANDADASLSKIGSNNGLEQAESKARRYWQSVDKAKDSTENLSRSMEGIRNAGVAFTLAGVGGLYLANSLIQVYKEGQKAEEKLDAMLKRRGEGGRLQEMLQWSGKLADTAAMVDDDPINDAAAGLLGYGLNARQIKEIMPGLIGQARLYNTTLDAQSEAFGRNFAAGNLKGLKRTGITFDPADLEAFDKLKKSGADWATVQAEMFRMVKKSLDEYALGITEGMSEAEKASNRVALAMDNAQKNIGKGSADAKQTVDGLVASLLTAANTSPALQETAGSVLYIGSMAMSAAGSIIGLAGQTGMAVLGLQSMGITGGTVMAFLRSEAMLTGVAMAGTFAAAGLALYLLYTRSQDLLAVWDKLRGGAESFQKISDDTMKVSNDPNATVEQKKAALKKGMERFEARGYSEEADKARNAYNSYLAPGEKRLQSQKTIEMRSKMQEQMKDFSDIMPQASAAPTASMPSLPAAPMGGGTSDLGTVDSAVASTGTTRKSSTSNAAEKLAKAAQREATKAQKASARAAEKMRLLHIKQVDARADADADVAIEQLQADTELRVKQMEEAGASPQQIAQVKAGATLREAELRGQGLKGQDDLGRERAMKLARIKAQHLVNMSAFEDGGGKKKRSINLPAFFRGGGSVFDLPADGDGAASTGGTGVSGSGRQQGQIVDFQKQSETVNGTGIDIVGILRIRVDKVGEVATNSAASFLNGLVNGLPFSPSAPGGGM